MRCVRFAAGSAPFNRREYRLRCLGGGGLRSWLAVRYTRTAALYFAAPPPPAAASPEPPAREGSRSRQILRHVCALRTEGARRRWQVRRSGSPRRNRPVRLYQTWNKPAWRTEQGERRAGKYRLARNTLCRGAEGESEHGAAGGVAPSVTGALKGRRRRSSSRGPIQLRR